MQMTTEGLKLIMELEGFREEAYRDAGGVWTIGYGHTGMAGSPAVRSGMVITRQEAERILARDVDMFARGVSRLVKTKLSDAQFSALVSFAYNVGLGNFRKSSVLTAVNHNDFGAVPRRLNLWIKAGGRALPGLVRRRAAEGAMFAADKVDAVEPVPAGANSGRRFVWSALAAAVRAIFARIRKWKEEGL